MRRLRKNKRGIELAVNFIVMLILAIAVFAGGLIFATKFFKETGKLRATLSAQTEAQIDAMLDDGSPFIIPRRVKTIYRKKVDTFGVGVYNVFKEEKTFYFKVYPKDNGFVAKHPGDEDKMTTENMKEFLLGVDGDGKSESFKVKPNEKVKRIFGINVLPEAKSGTYIFWVELHDPTKTPTLLSEAAFAPIQVLVKVP